VLHSLGRYDEAVAEIDAFAPIEAEELSLRHPSTLATRRLRASVLQSLGRYDEVLAEIPIEAEVLGLRHSSMPLIRHPNGC